MIRLFLLGIAAILLIGSYGVADPGTAKPVDFQRDIQPILQARCESCHGSEAREGGLRFLGRDDLFLRNDSGEPAIVAGEPSESELILRITAGEFERMPPEGPPLKDDQIKLLKRWIQEGASWPQTVKAPKHWAYESPARPEIPLVESGRIANPIDAFVLSTLEKSETGLQQSPPASPATRLRRVYLDLIGLPPEMHVLEAFEANPSDDHYREIVDQLLASSHYGEKWARQWLDLARYADSNGFQADQFREIWPYRDWVINSFNDDMPFDEFSIAQLAGDLLPESSLDDKVATGFHRCTTCNVEAGVDPEENRTNQIIDRVNTTGTVWLGTTLECAQCHNHKYDPFSQEEYYELFAFFNNTPLEVVQPGGKGVQFEVSGPKMDLPLTELQQQERDQFEEELKQLEVRIARREKALTQEQETWEDKLRSSLASVPQWHVLEPVKFESKNGSDYRILPDSSILLTGEAPNKDTYTASFSTDLKEITGFKIEALTDDSLPGKGPGRGDAKRPNFVAHELTASVTSEGDDDRVLKLHTPQASFSQKNYDVAGLIDGDPETAWAINPKFGEPHWASFLIEEAINKTDQGTESKPVTIRFELSQQFGGSRTIGRLRVQALTGNPEAATIPEDIREALLAEKERTEEQSVALADYHASQDRGMRRLVKQRKEIQSKIDAITPLTTLVMVEMDDVRETNIFQRGSFLSPGVTVEASVPGVLHSLSTAVDETEERDRLAFAKWLVSEENPLVARVAVNRWWSEFFGHGIVETLEDFGTQGERPTHPELLDWLAVEFMEHNWSMKHIHRTIVLSETYQQDSRIESADRELDSLNRLYARGPRFRLSAETIRDQALAISGLLCRDVGGPPVYPPQPENIWRHVGRNAPKWETDTDGDRFRRGLYVVWRRSAPYPSFVNFDAPDRASCVVKRSRTNTPLQALTLLNDPAYVEMAHGLANRMLVECTEQDSDELVELGFRLVTSRLPNSHEAAFLVSFLESEEQRFAGDPAAAKQVVPEDFRQANVAIEKQAACFELASVLLNLDESITKN
ncbi:PSD1 and planctomycete cytochrome C domain-containing protein [Thalassoglobus sp. JC818]|uniref:PSD1 and planctomycete cytochrome C domain-containing protein n=1 Tax=Thalassoglobus sp. JC818 TaxID=3232136 RepID=UPI00345AF2EC